MARLESGTFDQTTDLEATPYTATPGQDPEIVALQQLHEEVDGLGDLMELLSQLPGREIES